MKIGNELVGILDHQVAVEGQVSRLAQGLDYGRPNGEVRDEMAVHDIDMNHGGATFGGTTDLVRQMGEIRRQNGWC